MNDDLRTGKGVSLEAAFGHKSFSGRCRRGQELLSASIEKAVHEQTGGGIAHLAVMVDEGGVFLHGSCSSYYHKQLAQHAAMAVPNGLTLTNCIEVD